MAESEEELKSLLMNMKEESEKAGLKLNIQTTKIMASSPITGWDTDGVITSLSHHILLNLMASRWQNNGNSETLYFLVLQNHCRIVTAAMKLKDTCSLEEKL